MLRIGFHQIGIGTGLLGHFGNTRQKVLGIPGILIIHQAVQGLGQNHMHARAVGQCGMGQQAIVILALSLIQTPLPLARQFSAIHRHLAFDHHARQGAVLDAVIANIKGGDAGFNIHFRLANGLMKRLTGQVKRGGGNRCAQQQGIAGQSGQTRFQYQPLRIHHVVAVRGELGHGAGDDGRIVNAAFSRHFFHRGQIARAVADDAARGRSKAAKYQAT